MRLLTCKVMLNGCYSHLAVRGLKLTSHSLLHTTGHASQNAAADWTEEPALGEHALLQRSRRRPLLCQALPL